VPGCRFDLDELRRKQNHPANTLPRLSRLTNTFSKKFKNFKAAAALHYGHYSFVKYRFVDCESRPISIRKLGQYEIHLAALTFSNTVRACSSSPSLFPPLRNCSTALVLYVL
jgi:hypothetical protein